MVDSSGNGRLYMLCRKPRRSTKTCLLARREPSLGLVAPLEFSFWYLQAHGLTRDDWDQLGCVIAHLFYFGQERPEKRGAVIH
jgi:hypothetical protein